MVEFVRSEPETRPALAMAEQILKIIKDSDDLGDDDEDVVGGAHDEDEADDEDEEDEEVGDDNTDDVPDIRSPQHDDVGLGDPAPHGPTGTAAATRRTQGASSVSRPNRLSLEDFLNVSDLPDASPENTGDDVRPPHNDPQDRQVPAVSDDQVAGGARRPQSPPAVGHRNGPIERLPQRIGARMPINRRPAQAHGAVDSSDVVDPLNLSSDASVRSTHTEPHGDREPSPSERSTRSEEPSVSQLSTHTQPGRGGERSLSQPSTHTQPGLDRESSPSQRSAHNVPGRDKESSVSERDSHTPRGRQREPSPSQRSTHRLPGRDRDPSLSQRTAHTPPALDREASLSPRGTHSQPRVEGEASLSHGHARPHGEPAPSALAASEQVGLDGEPSPPSLTGRALKSLLPGMEASSAGGESLVVGQPFAPAVPECETQDPREGEASLSQKGCRRVLGRGRLPSASHWTPTARGLTSGTVLRVTSVGPVGSGSQSFSRT